MQPETEEKLRTLRADFAQVTGQPFQHFFCPILFKDEESTLCRAHIVNLAFPESSRSWTIQRKDVDNFYGSMFESDFANLRYAYAGIAAEAFVDPEIYQRLHPRLLLNGEEVRHFVAKGAVPARFAQRILEYRGRTVRLAFPTMTPEEWASKADADWQTDVAKDLRLPAIVSVLKAAHLTMFEMLGYRYALSLGGNTWAAYSAGFTS